MMSTYHHAGVLMQVAFVLYPGFTALDATTTVNRVRPAAALN